MSHDLLAELDAYRTELAGYERAKRPERADIVRPEVARVLAAIRAQVQRLVAEAESYEEHGQDGLAARARTEAARLRRALAAEETPAVETATQSALRETAVPPKKRGA